MKNTHIRPDSLSRLKYIRLPATTTGGGSGARCMSRTKLEMKSRSSPSQIGSNICVPLRTETRLNLNLKNALACFPEIYPGERQSTKSETVVAISSGREADFDL